MHSLPTGKKIGIKLNGRHLLRKGLGKIRILDGPEFLLCHCIKCLYVLDLYQDGEMERLMNINSDRDSYLGTQTSTYNLDFSNKSGNSAITRGPLLCRP